MTPPKRPPKQATPIRHDPHEGQYRVVVSFQYDAPWPLEQVRVRFQDEVLRLLGHLAIDRYGNTSGPVDVAVLKIGAGGEASEHEQWPPGSAGFNTGAGS